jgi:hypothetical protein
LALPPLGYCWRIQRRKTDQYERGRRGKEFGKIEAIEDVTVHASSKEEKRMSLKLYPIGPVPEETARIARAAYPRGNIYLQLRDEFGTIYEDEDFVNLYPQRGQPAEAPWRLALVSVMQFREGLSDRQAADAVRGRLDWKYLLGLEVDDPGFDASVLVEFR